MKSNLIIKEAKEVKTFIEKNKDLPKFCTIGDNEYSIYTTAYLFAKLLTNPKASDVKVKTIKAPNKTFTGKINEKITSPDYKDMIKRYVKYVEENERTPVYITSVKTKTEVKYDLFIYCLAKIIVFYFNNNNTFPLYCEFKTTDLIKEKKKEVKKAQFIKNNCTNPYTSEPHYTSEGCNKLGQCTGWWCGPHSIHQAIKKFGITNFTEKQIAAWAGATTSGTGHPGLQTAIAQISKKSGIKLSVQWKNFSDMGSTNEERLKNIAEILCKDNKAIIWHIAYINGGSSTNGKHFGHYECIDKINTSSKFVRALNSLGNKKSDGSYTGKLQDRTYNVQSYFAKNTPGGQPALCIITKG